MNGQNIAKYRKKMGITQEELAERLSITNITLSRWENGHFEPKISIIKKLCEILGCTESELLNDSVSDNWELRIVINKENKEVIDMSGEKSSAVLNISDNSMAITLSAGYELWEDEEKFEGLIEQLKKKRTTGLKTRKEGW